MSVLLKTATNFGATGGGSNGSISAPYSVTGADVAAVLAALVPYQTSGAYAVATIGSDTWLLVYDSTDARWYGVVEDGSELAPFTTTTASGSGALASLPAPTTDAYGVIARGTGSEVVVRGLAVTSSGDGYVSRLWVPSVVHAFGAPSTADVVARYPDPADWTYTFASGSLAANSGKVTLTNGASGIDVVQTVASRPTASKLGLFFVGSTFAGVTATSTQLLIRVNTSSGSGQYLMVECGGAGSPGGQTTKLNVYNSSGTRIDSGLLLTSLTYWVAILDIATDVLTIYSDGASVYSATCVITSADAYRAKFQTQSVVTGSALGFSTHVAATWA